MENKLQKIFDYIQWRGDLDFDAAPFNEIDGAVLCLLSYLDYTGLVSAAFRGETLTISTIDSLYFGRALPSDLRVLDLLKACSKSKRFGQVKVFGHVSKLDGEESKQFCGITYVLPSKKKQACIVFRGTDVTLIGWKEDFNMMFTFPIPCQEEARQYLEIATKAFRGYELYLAGHSKGGNAAIYASSFCTEKAFNRLKSIYTFDSPGFDKDLVDIKIFKRVQNKIKSFIPKDSVIGMLLENPIGFTVVDSDAFGLSQHDVFSWGVKGTKFITCDSVTSFSIGAKKTMTRWLELLDMQQRRKFVDVLFDILDECGIKEIRDFEKGDFSTVLTAVKFFAGLDDTSKDCVFKALGLFFKAAHERNSIELENIQAKRDSF